MSHKTQKESKSGQFNQAALHKRIGIVGGVSPESTVSYYLHIVRKYRELFGDFSFPEIIIYSVSLQRFRDWIAKDDWSMVTQGLIDDVRRLHAAGANFGLMAANVLHFVFDEVREKSPIPLISIIEATAKSVREEGMRKVGLMGTSFTMERSFYVDGLAKYGIEAMTPAKKSDRDYIHHVAEEEITRGLINAESRKNFLRIINDLVERGAQGIVLGCTEIPLLVKPEHTSIKLFDTAEIHADRALEFAIGSQKDGL
jgi:aspartate racemase